MNLNAPIHDSPATTALRMAMPILYEELRMICEVDCEGSFGNARAPDPGSCLPESRHLLERALAAVRAGETVLGRDPQLDPAWLAEVIDGRVTP